MMIDVIVLILIISLIAKPKWILGLTIQSLEYKHETKNAKFDTVCCPIQNIPIPYRTIPS